MRGKIAGQRGIDIVREEANALEIIVVDVEREGLLDVASRAPDDECQAIRRAHTEFEIRGIQIRQHGVVGVSRAMRDHLIWQADRGF